MSALWCISLLVFKNDERVQNSVTGFGWLNNVVNITTLCCLERVAEALLVLLCLFFGVLAPEDDLDGTLGSHYCNLSVRPGVVKVTLQVLGRHDIIGTTVCFARDKSDLGDSRLGIRIQELGTVFDNAVELLVGARQEAWDVRKGHNRDLEGITEPDKACAFN